jgi:hypothetical protein
VELFKLIPDIESARLSDLDVEDADVPEDFQPARKKAPHGRITRAQDPKLRAAIERRALDVALAYYEGLGGALLHLAKPRHARPLILGLVR